MLVLNQLDFQSEGELVQDVSILVLMDVGLKLKNFFRDGIYSERVSILVLMDVGLKRCAFIFYASVFWFQSLF